MNIAPYKSFEDVSSSNLVIRRILNDSMPNEYKESVYQSMRRDLGNRLLDFLDRFKSPCVVEIIETRRPGMGIEWQYYPVEEITIEAKVRNVQYKDVVILRLSLSEINLGLWQRLVWVITGKIPEMRGKNEQVKTDDRSDI